MVEMSYLLGMTNIEKLLIEIRSQNLFQDFKKIFKDIKLKQDSLCEKNFHKIFRYCKNENLVDWFIDDSAVHDDFELEIY